MQRRGRQRRGGRRRDSAIIFDVGSESAAARARGGGGGSGRGEVVGARGRESQHVIWRGVVVFDAELVPEPGQRADQDKAGSRDMVVVDGIY